MCHHWKWTTASCSLPSLLSITLLPVLNRPELAWMIEKISLLKLRQTDCIWFFHYQIYTWWLDLLFCRILGDIQKIARLGAIFYRWISPGGFQMCVCCVEKGLPVYRVSQLHRFCKSTRALILAKIRPGSVSSATFLMPNLQRRERKLQAKQNTRVNSNSFKRITISSQ